MSGAIDEAVTFEDEDGEANELPTEFATATMGHVLLGQGRHDAAREVFRAALAKDPGDLEAARGLLGKQGRHQAVQMRPAIPCDDDHRRSWVHLRT